MNEPKKRGRPAKVAELETHVVSMTPTNDVDEFARRRAKAYALRVWNGQSSGLPRAVRIDRVRKALESQGMSMEGIEL